MKGPVKSAYIVYTQVIALGGRPFCVDGLRPIWKRIFNSATCFTDNRDLVFSGWRNTYWNPDLPDEIKGRFPDECRKLEESNMSIEVYYERLLEIGAAYDTFNGMPPAITIPRPSKPFLRGLGSIFFDTHAARLTSKYGDTRRRLADLITGRQQWDPRFLEVKNEEVTGDKRPDDDGGDDRFPIFGYDPKVADQRMNALYFELSRPVMLKAETHGDAKVSGRIFVHIYPSGYLVIQVPISLNWQSPKSIQNVKDLLRETKPDRLAGNWSWSSRIGRGSLRDIVELAKRHLWASFFEQVPRELHEGTWQSALKVVTTSELKQDSANTLITGGDYESVALSRRTHTGKHLLSSRQGLVCVFKSRLRYGHELRRVHSRLFWKVLVFAEFVALKNQVYDDVGAFLRLESLRLKGARLSIARKLLEDDLTNLSVYDHTVGKFFAALDQQIVSAAPFHRRIYSAISKGSGFTARRERLKKLVDEWEKEVERWDPPVMVIWKKVVSPLRAFFTAT
jgi:hypothetical protein